MITAVIAAGGKGTRMGADVNKIFLTLLGHEIIYHTVKAFENHADIDEIIVVTAKNDIEKCREILSGFKKITAVIEGGNTRQESVRNGILKAKGNIILIHDGARALISQREITDVICDCKKYGAASVGVKPKDTLKSVKDGFILKTIDRENTYLIQTPQAFSAEIIKKAHENAYKNGLDFTDDNGAAEVIGVKIKVTEGSYENIKITTPEDLLTAENILKRRKIK